MKKFILFLAILMALPFSFADNYQNSTDQQVFLHWPVEIGSGNIVLDQSLYNHHGLLVGTTTNMWDNSFPKFGTYAIDLDGNNDWIDAVDTLAPAKVQTLSFWARAHTNSGVIHMFEQTSGGAYHFHVYNDFTANEVLFAYFNETSNHNVVTIGTGLAQNTYKHVVISLDAENNRILGWLDGVLTYNESSNGAVLIDQTPLGFRFGARLDESGDFDGQMDEMRMFNFVPSQAQVDELFSSNTLTLEEHAPDPETEPTPVLDLVSYPIINTTTPTQGANVDHPATISATLNTISTCDLYINNKLHKTYTDVLGFSEEISSLDADATHEYFLYCSFVNNGTNYFELQEKVSFNINQFPPTQVTFDINGVDFDITNLGLYVHTPCLEEGHSAIGLEGFEPYRPKFNPDGAYFIQADANGFATFNLTPAEYEFCVFAGRLTYNEVNQTTNYQVVDYEGFAKIGTINIPNQISSSFVVNLEALDLYEVIDPKAYGKTWAGVILGLFLMVIGTIILIAGFGSGQPKAIFIGAIVLLAGAGIEIPSLIGVIV